MRRGLLGLMFATAAACGLSSAAPDDPPEKLTAAKRKKLEAEWEALSEKGTEYAEKGKSFEASRSFTEALQLARRLYPKATFPRGHENLVTSLQNLAGTLSDQFRYADAEPLERETLDILMQLEKVDENDIAEAAENLA